MGRRVDPVVTDPKRIRQFAGFFKNYMGISTFVVAALPLPAAYLRLIPMYDPDKGSTSVIASLLCFLLLSYIFYGRHRAAQTLFYEIEPVASGPSEPGFFRLVRPQDLRRGLYSVTILLLIVATAALFFMYQLTWMRSEVMIGVAVSGHYIPGFDPAIARLSLMAYYVGFFVCAEAAFVMMASKEYLQDILSLSDNDLIRGPEAGAASAGPAPPSG